MKRIILGSVMMLGGMIGSALLLAGSMSADLRINGEYSSMWNLQQYGLDSALYIFITIAVVGLIINISELLNKEN